MLKKLLILLIINFSIQSLAKADDIKDLEIEGISIGDNALDHMSEKILEENKSYYPNSKKIWKVYLELTDKNFDIIQMHIKDENNKYIIVAIAGIIFFEDRSNQKNCINKRAEIVNDLTNILKNTKKSEEEKNIHDADKTGKSYELGIFFDFKDDYSEYVKVGCTFFSQEYFNLSNIPNYLRLSLTSSEYHFWLHDEAYQ